MAVAFTYAAVYQVAAVCRTPLRTGGTSGDPEQILRGRDGCAFVQGSSLAGALRGWLEAAADSGLVKSLFGSQEMGGHLIVSNAMFDGDTDQYTRPRLKIDAATAAGEDRKKFDMANAGTGAKLSFSLTWLGVPEDAQKELPAVEQALAAMHAGAIRLGAQKTNGFGQLSLTVKKRTFNLQDGKDRRDWLKNKLEGKTLTLPSLEQKRGAVFLVKGHSDNLLVKTAPEYCDTPDGLRSYTPNLHEGERIILPGSSIKGAVRGRCAYIAKRLNLEEGFVDQYFGREDRPGDNGLPGQVCFEDGTLSGVKKDKLSRIRIDRFTGGVFRGGLFTEEPVSADIVLKITAPEEPALCALLLYALRDLGLGLYNLGSGWAIGRGQVGVRAIQASMPDGRTAALYPDGQGGIKPEDPSGLFQEWLERLEGICHEA